MNNIEPNSYLWGWFAFSLVLEYWPAVLRGSPCQPLQECHQDTFWDALNGAEL